MLLTTYMTRLAVSKVQFFAKLEFEWKGMRPEEDAVMGTGDSLDGGMTHCRDVSTGIDQLSVCSDSCLFVDPSSL